MAHYVLQYQGRKPAWHMLATDTEGNTRQGASIFGPDSQYTARSAAEAIGGVFEVERMPLFAKVGEDYVQIPYHVMKVIDSDEFTGVPIADNYYPVDNDVIIAVWDQVVGHPIETIFTLKPPTGRVFGLSSELPAINVGGKEVQQFLVAGNWFTGRNGIDVMRTMIRPVCWNTFSASLEMMDDGEIVATHERHTFRHTDENPVKRLEIWLRHMYEQATKVDAIELALNHLAQYAPTEIEIQWIYEQAWPTLHEPQRQQYPSMDHDPDEKEWERAYKRYQYLQSFNTSWKDFVRTLFDGEMTGSEEDDVNYNLWRVHQAAVEGLNWGVSLNKDGSQRKTNQQAQATAILNGWRADKARTVLNACFAIANHTAEL